MIIKVVPEQHAETHPSVKHFFKKVQPEKRNLITIPHNPHVQTQLIEFQLLLD